MFRHAVMRWSFVVALTIPLQGMQGADNNGSIAGVVSNASGKPVSGATVRLRDNLRGVTVTVFSQGQGRYNAANLPPGKYVVYGTGGGFRSDPQITVDLDSTRAAEQNLTLNQEFQEPLSSSQYAELIPDEDWRKILIATCTDCHHELQRIVPRRASRDEWADRVEKMRHNPFGFYRSLEMTDQRKIEIVDYLSKNFGTDKPPADVRRFQAGSWVTGAAAKAVVTEHDLPRGAAAHDVAVDSKGIGWVNEGGTGLIGYLDPRSQTYTHIPSPVKDGSNMPQEKVSGINIDPQDRVWFENRADHSLGVYDPKTQKFSLWPFPKPPKGTNHMNMVRFRSDGTVWLPEIGGNQVVKFDPATEKFTEYLVPSAKLGNVQVYGMAIDKSQKIWFTERNLSNKVGGLDPKTGEITEYSLPTPGAIPRRMAADAEGNLWFGEYGSGKLGMIDYRTGKITEYPTPTKYSGAYCVDVDRKRNIIWVNEMLADKIARFDPRTKTFVEYPIPTRYSSVRRIEVDPSRPTRIWYTGLWSDKVGYMDVE